ncbi:MAG: class I SAM-dependent methyltransferase [Gammaproteobacteria bacterium]|nr:class I SAM-dependent methyltransferase [Gammaproteobacteria bacterium]
MTACANDYTTVYDTQNYRKGLIPVVSRSLGSWRLSIDRQAYQVSELAERYDDAAMEWQNTLNRLGVNRAYSSLAVQVLAQLDRSEDSAPIRLLECGAGTAEFSRAMVLASDHEFRISAVDISSAMKNQAVHTFEKSGLSLDYQVADIRDLPFADQSQDVVIATHVLEHLADPDRALLEIHRVLKPGGLVFLCCTKQSLSGRWIQMKWRTHCVTPATVRQWLDHGMFEAIRFLPINRQSRLRNFSVALTANKLSAV